MSRKEILIVFSLCATVLFFACSEENDLTFDRVHQKVKQETAANSFDKAFVSKEQAIGLAESFFGQQTNETTLRSANRQRSIASIETLQDQNHPVMYVLNYEEGGFAIISATRSYYPVLAYSDENSFILSEDMGGVSVWLDETKEAIKVSDKLDEKAKATIRTMWTIYEGAEGWATSNVTLRRYDPLMAAAFATRSNQLYLQYGPLGWYGVYSLEEAEYYFTPMDYATLCQTATSYGSPPEYTIIVLKPNYTMQTIGPLLSTKWHQGNPFNSQIPLSVDAGCATIALSQIMKFHRKPALVTSPSNHHYNWDNMPDSGAPSGSSTPYLIHHVAKAIHSIPLPPFGTLALPLDVELAIRYTFGYSVSRSAHNSGFVWTEVFSNKNPVMMLGFTGGMTGHYWVCDGARANQNITTFFIEFINPNNYTYYSSSSGWNPSNPGVSVNGTGPTEYNMNWGWGGSCNGWFINNDVNSGLGNFQYSRENYYIRK